MKLSLSLGAMSLALLAVAAFAEQATVMSPKPAFVQVGAPTVIVDPSVFDPSRTPARRPDAAPTPSSSTPTPNTPGVEPLAKPKQGLLNASAPGEGYD